MTKCDIYLVLCSLRNTDSAKDLLNLYILLDVTTDKSIYTLSCSFPDTLCLVLSPSSFCFSPSLGLLGYGATQGLGFGELHEGWLDRGEVPRDLVHGLLVGTGSVWFGEGPQVLLGVWGSSSEPDAKLGRDKDGQGEGVSLWQQLVLPHPSFHGAHSEDTRGAGLCQWAGLPLPGESLPTRGVIHVHCLPAGIREKLD